MPGPAADGGQVPFRNAKEEIRARVEGSENGGGQQRPGAHRQRQNIVWRNVVLMSLLHLGAVYSLALIPTAKPLTLLWGKFRRRPLCPGHRGEAAPGRAGSPAAAALAPRFSHAPGCLDLRLSGLWDRLVFLCRYLLLLPPPRSGRVGAFAGSWMESGRDPESCGCTAVLRGAPGDALGTG